MRPLRRRMQIIYQDPYESLDPRFRVAADDRRAAASTASARGAQSGAQLVVEALELRRASTPPELLHRTLPARALGRPAPARRDRGGLVVGPELLIADEPVSMLDVSVRAGVMALLDGCAARTASGS